MTLEGTFAQLVAAGDAESFAVAHDIAEEMGWAFPREDLSGWTRRAHSRIQSRHNESRRNFFLRNEANLRYSTAMSGTDDRWFSCVRSGLRRWGSGSTRRSSVEAQQWT